MAPTVSRSRKAGTPHGRATLHLNRKESAARCRHHPHGAATVRLAVDAYWPGASARAGDSSWGSTDLGSGSVPAHHGQRVVARHSDKCLGLAAPAGNCIQFSQPTCDGSGAQSFQITAR